MVFLPIIANNLGKTAAAAATTLGVVGYVNRERIGRWFADESDHKERTQGRFQGLAGVLERAESLKNLHGQLAPDEPDKKHAVLLDKLASLNTNAVAEFKGLINDVHEELGSMAEPLQQLRAAIANLKTRQDTVEALVRGRPHEERASNGKEEPSSPAPRQAAGRTTALGGKRRGNGPAGPDSRPA